MLKKPTPFGAGFFVFLRADDQAYSVTSTWAGKM